jgi:putative intracellular protease/amidase
LKEHGAIVHVVSPQAGEIRGWETKDWGRPVNVDVTLDEARAQDYDAIVLPGDKSTPTFCASTTRRCGSFAPSSIREKLWRLSVMPLGF